MAKKKKRRSAARDTAAVGPQGSETMTTEPFSPDHAADPAGDTARIAPVTAEMMDHAAKAAADSADAVAHAASETAQAPVEPSAPDVDAPSSMNAEAAVAANENAAAAAGATAAPEPLGAGDLAFNHGASGRDRAARGPASPVESLGLLNAKMMEIAAANVAAAGEFVSALLAAKTMPEAAAVNAQYMRRAFEAMSSQGRELMTLGQKVALDAARSAGDASHRL